MDSFPPVTSPYFGSFKHQLDPKNRLTVPAKWRTAGDDNKERSFYMAWPHHRGYLAVFPPAKAEAFKAQARTAKITDARQQAALRAIFGRAFDFSVDSAGRVVLPEELLRHAGIAREAVFVGQSDFFEIWCPERLQPENEDAEAMEEALRTLGF